MAPSLRKSKRSIQISLRVKNSKYENSMYVYSYNIFPMKIIIIFFFRKTPHTHTRKNKEERWAQPKFVFSFDPVTRRTAARRYLGFCFFLLTNTFIYSLFLCAIRDDIIRYYSLKLIVICMAVCVSTGWDTNIRES
jgi:hypothetical protein